MSTGVKTIVALALRSRWSASTAPQIHLGQHVAVEDDHRLGQRVAGVADGARRPERHGFDDVAQLEAEAFAIAEDLFDPPRLIVQAQDGFVDLRHLAQLIDLVVEKRPVEDRHDGLRRVDGQGPQARAFPPGEQDSFHDNRRSYTDPMRIDAECVKVVLRPSALSSLVSLQPSLQHSARGIQNLFG